MAVCCQLAETLLIKTVKELWQRLYCVALILSNMSVGMGLTVIELIWA